MIFEQIVSEVCDRLNLSSDDAKSRVGRYVNTRYRRVTSSIGLDTSRRTQVSKIASIGNRFIEFTGINKLFAVIDKTDPQQDIVLEQITVDEMHITPIRTEPPRHYAVYNMSNDTVNIEIDCIPATTFTLYADGMSTVTTLSGGQAPQFPEDFHDILVFGALADEYRKLQQVQLQHDAETDYERRLSDLRGFIAKSAYLDQTQGRYNDRSFRWSRDAQLLWDR